MVTLHQSAQPHIDAGHALNAALKSVHEHDHLVLFSGGSALMLADSIDHTLLSPRMTIGMVDERYTTDPAVSNFSQLTSRDVWSHAQAAGVSWIDPRPQPTASLEDTAHRVNIALKHWHITHHTGAVIAVLGVGADGHTAGVLPFPEDPTLFASLFFEEHRCVRGYQVDSKKNPHTKRITTTLSYLKRHVTHAIVYVAGEDKHAVLTALLAPHPAPLAELPAGILHALPLVEIYTDLIIE